MFVRQAYAIKSCRLDLSDEQKFEAAKKSAASSAALWKNLPIHLQQQFQDQAFVLKCSVEQAKTDQLHEVRQMIELHEARQTEDDSMAGQLLRH